MPANATWSQYLKFTAASMLTMFAGSQTVHKLYRPLDDLDKYVQEELAKLEGTATVESSSNSGESEKSHSKDTL